MEKVTRRAGGDNRRRSARAPGAALALVLMLLVTASGCGGGRDDTAGGTDQDGGPAATTRRVADACPLVLDWSAVAAFYDLADRVAAGEAVTIEEMGQVVSGPTWDHWRRSFAPERIAPARVARSLFIALRGQEELPARLRSKAVELEQVRNYTFALDQRERLTTYLEEFVATDVLCEVPTLLEGWVPAGALPDTLRVDLVVGLPEIRYFEERFLLDPGLAWASGREQIVRFLASTLYRDVAAIEGVDPDQAQGPDIALHTLRLLRNEAVPAYLDQLADIAFDGRHPVLAHAAVSPVDLCDQALRSLQGLDAVLTRLRNWEDPGQAEWSQVYRFFVGSQSWQSTSWFMARTVAAALGEDRLREASTTVRGFWAAYQEAALAMPEEPVARRTSVVYFLQQAPPLSPENAAWIDRELARLFG